MLLSVAAMSSALRRLRRPRRVSAGDRAGRTDSAPAAPPFGRGRRHSRPRRRALLLGGDFSEQLLERGALNRANDVLRERGCKGLETGFERTHVTHKSKRPAPASIVI